MFFSLSDSSSKILQLLRPPFYPLFESLVTKKTRDSGPINNV